MKNYNHKEKKVYPACGINNKEHDLCVDKSIEIMEDDNLLRKSEFVEAFEKECERDELLRRFIILHGVEHICQLYNEGE